MTDEGAAAAMAAAVTAALKRVPGLSGAFDGAPIQAADAHAEVQIGPETDWGHKTGAGAELRFAVVIRTGGERPDRARALSSAARAAVEAIGPTLTAAAAGSGAGWRLVSLAMMRARVAPARGEAARGAARPGWTGSVDYRARLLREEN
jgi:hypothetical protein